MLMHCDMNNQNFNQVNNLLNESNPIDMDNQMNHLLDTTHITIHTNPTNLDPMYMNQ